MTWQVNNRLIQGYGLYKFTEDEKRARNLELRVDLIRYPEKSLNLNTKSSPPETFLGYCTYERNKAFLQKKSIDYPNQLLDNYFNYSAWNWSLQRCHLAAVNYSFVQLGLALSLSPFELAIPFQDWTLTLYPWDSIRIKLLDLVCIARIQCRYLPLDMCGITQPAPTWLEDDDNPIPEILPYNQPFTGNISPPYDGVDDDGLTYVPEPEGSGFPVGQRCTLYRVVFRVGYSDTDWNPVTRDLWGELEGIYTGLGDWEFEGWGFACHGLSNQECFITVQKFPTGSPYPYVAIESITAI